MKEGSMTNTHGGCGCVGELGNEDGVAAPERLPTSETAHLRLAGI